MSYQLARLFSIFVVVGAISTILHYIVLVILVHWFSTDAVLASTAGYISSSLVNYWLNYHFTFASSKPHLSALPKFALVVLIGLTLNSLSMAVAFHLLGLHYLLAQLISTLVVLIWNFTANLLWSFREPVFVDSTLTHET